MMLCGEEDAQGDPMGGSMPASSFPRHLTVVASVIEKESVMGKVSVLES